MSESNPSHQHLLRTSLRANALFSATTGAVLVVGGGVIADYMGIRPAWIVRAVGASLLLFASGLLRNAGRAVVNRIEAWLTVVMDVAWVVGSGALVLAGVPTSGGNRLVAGIADIVLLFAIVQYVGLRAARREIV